MLSAHQRLAALAVTVAVIAANGAGCGSSSKSSNASTSSSAVSTTTTTEPVLVEAETSATPSAGCDLAPPAAVQLERRTVQVADLERWYLVTVPPASPPTAARPAEPAATPLPLVLDFHGFTEGAVSHAQMTGFSPVAESEGFIAVFPQGLGDLARWSAGPGGDATGDNPDLAFTEALLDQLEASLCVDTSRVYAAGLSNGAMMTSMLACRLADRLAAVAPIAGIAAYGACEPDRAVPMLTIHGTADPILLFNGGVGDLVKLISGGPSGQGGQPATEAPETTTIPVDIDGAGYPANTRAWAERNGCAPNPTDTAVSPEVTLRTYDGPVDADVQMYIVTGGGHAWPGSEFSRNVAAIVGHTTFDIDATQLIWEFFTRFRLPERSSGAG